MHPKRFASDHDLALARPIARRRFLAVMGSAAGLMVLPSARSAFAYPANERLRLAVAGVAGYGAWHGFAESRGIYHDWMDACRGGQPRILANFENGGRLSELLMLGNIATLYPGETLAYDPVAGQISSHAEANTTLAFKYRDGWRL